MAKFSVMFARFPYGRRDEPDVTDWLMDTLMKAKSDPRISDVFNWRLDDTPIPMGRNRSIEQAKKLGADYLLMVDNDMAPDAYHVGNPNKVGIDVHARPFWDTSFDFMQKNLDDPCIIAAPYCGPPPIENVYVFRWADWQSQQPNDDGRLEQFSREEAATRAGIEEVGALPTGLILLDMRVFKNFEPPYFYYEWADEPFQTQKASTEDVTFTRDLSLQGTRIFCNWDAWAGHWKWKCVGKPGLITVDSVRDKFVNAVKRNHNSKDRMIEVHGLKDPALVRLIRSKRLQNVETSNGKDRQEATVENRSETGFVRCSQGSFGEETP